MMTSAPHHRTTGETVQKILLPARTRSAGLFRRRPPSRDIALMAQGSADVSG